MILWSVENNAPATGLATYEVFAVRNQESAADTTPAPLPADLVTIAKRVDAGCGGRPTEGIDGLWKYGTTVPL